MLKLVLFFPSGTWLMGCSSSALANALNTLCVLQMHMRYKILKNVVLEVIFFQENPKTGHPTWSESILGQQGQLEVS